MDVVAWLESLGLGQYAAAFAANDIDEDTITALDGDDLKELGVASLGHRKKLLAAISVLRGEAPLPVSVSDGGLKPNGSSAQDVGGMPTGDRRQVTVLFADITGYTNLSTEIDAEELSDIVAHIFAAVDAIIDDFGGTVDKHIGDEVMALFGAPIAHDDDPLRAVRAAFEIHKAMDTISADLKRDLSLHIGIASGSVVAKGVGAQERNEYTVMGPSVNLAARLNAQAKGRETIVSEDVRRAAGSVADFESLGAIEVKGFDKPVPAWRVTSQSTGNEPSHLGTFVGRRAELRQLTGAVDACAETGTGQCIIIRGEAGMGKSRLVSEFSAIAAKAGFSVHKGLVLDFGVGRGKDAMREVAANMLGLPSGCPSEVRQAAADKALASGLVKDDDRPFLNDLLDLPQTAEERGFIEAMDNELRNTRKFAFVTNLIKQKTKAGPVLIVIEDLHWADALTLRFVATVANMVTTCPALLALTTRIEGDPLDQTWRSMTRNCPFLTIDLGPLREDEAAEMAGGLFDKSLEFGRKCILRAEGNPLFLEQLLRNSQEHDDEIPASLQSLVLARMDRLPPLHKQALQVASVIGQRFGLEGVRAILGDPAYDCRELVEHTLVHPEGGDFLFAHALVQQGVYSSLLSATRKRLHKSAAAYYERFDPTLCAQHLDRAGDPGAPKAYLSAAKAQSDLYHFEDALSLAERGLAIVTDASERTALLCCKGEKLRNLGDTEGSVVAYREALAVASNDADRVPAWIGLAEAARFAGRTDEGLEYLEQAQPAAEQAGLDLSLAEIHHLRGNLVFPLGEYEKCRQEHETSLHYAEKAHSIEMKARALGGLGDAYYSVGKMLTAHRYLNECIKLAQENSLSSIEVSYLIMRTDTHYYLGEMAAARADSERARKMAVEVGNRRAEFFALWVASAMFIFDPDYVQVESLHADIDRMTVLVDQLGLKPMVPLLPIAKAIENRMRGLPNDDKALRDGYAQAKQSGVTFGGGWILATLTWLTSDPETRHWAMAEADTILTQQRCVSHNYLFFYQLAIEVSLDDKDWTTVERYCQALEAYTRDEPFPLSEFVLRRARALKNFATGDHGEPAIAELEQLRDEAARMEFVAAIPAIDSALARSKISS